MSSFLTSLVFLFPNLFVNTLEFGLYTERLTCRAGGARVGKTEGMGACSKAAHSDFLKGYPSMPLTHFSPAASLVQELWKMEFLARFDDNISDTNYFFLDIIVGLRAALGFSPPSSCHLIKVFSIKSNLSTGASPRWEISLW